MKKITRKVKVWDMPATWILTDSKLSDEEIKMNWMIKHANSYNSILRTTLRKKLASQKEEK